jgi:hypothetical protein
MLRQFIENVREEKAGFSLSKPWRLEEKSTGVIIPILRKSSKKRDYITFPEAFKVKAEDTGHIDYIYVKNDEDKPVLISRGEIFRGKSQERAVVHDVLVMPGVGMRVAVKCIHASKGINQGSKMEYGGKIPYSISLENQNTTWGNVNTYSTSFTHIGGQITPTSGETISDSSNISNNTFQLNSVFFAGDSNVGGTPNAASDDLHKTLNNLSQSIREIMKKIPPIKNQVGAAFFQKNTFQGMDVFDLKESWTAIKDDVVAKEGASFIDRDEDDKFEFKPEKGMKKLKKELTHNYEEKTIFKDKNSRLVQVSSESLIGEGLIFNDKVIHLTLWNKN